MKFVALLLLFLAVSLLSVGSAVAAPFIGFSVDGARQMVEVPWYTDSRGVTRVDSWSYSTSEFVIEIKDVAMAGPSIAYALAVTDFGASSAFSFLFATPIAPTGSPNVVYGSIVGGLTDYTGDGVSITPLVGSNVQTSSVGFPLTNMGIDVGPGLSAAPGTPGALHTYGAYSVGTIAGPGPGPWTWMEVTSEFQLSGNGDIAVLTGFSNIEETSAPVPEPASFVLMGGGLFAVAMARWRKKVLAR